MSYYRGDYYRGGRGDPFSIGGIIGGIGKFVGGGIKALTGGGGSGTPPIASMPGGSFPQLGTFLQGGTQPGKPKPGITGAIERFLPGGNTGFLKSRRMNVTNSRALRRAIRRVSGFGKLVQRSKKAIARANTAVGNKHRAVKRGRR